MTSELNCFQIAQLWLLSLKHNWVNELGSVYKREREYKGRERLDEGGRELFLSVHSQSKICII